MGRWGQWISGEHNLMGSSASSPSKGIHLRKCSSLLSSFDEAAMDIRANPRGLVQRGFV
ncbi:hypothetical protein JMJ77_0004052 [Colletotrichum scovillei]|uniref:Uncharacterized protein n=1 Tax=Colletotrichum scovillei TaxID=1209932 RepID=A0A9P7U8P4_9PEZI|nr:hypothetical protein JMJ77_0004052 [Colletotrichum scovillei]KAG7049301.1 hypothetical protein JMJ78_0013284 [Colletotrichum scovillei]KAG7064042.1 hypothetical protein JMJ76_0007090 [Colletotrichum scovillei]